MSKRLMAHDPDNCHPVTERPEENHQIVINTNNDLNGEINIGYYSKNKWFLTDDSEIQEDNIMCWHELDGAT